MTTRRQFIEGLATLPLSYFFLPHTIGSLGMEETTDEMISRGGPFSVALLPVDQVNTNDRIYPEKVVREAIDSLPNNTLMGGMGFPILDGKVILKDVAFTATHLRIAHNNDYCNGKWLWGDIRIINTPQGLLMKNLLREQGLDAYAFRTAGIGGFSMIEAGRTMGTNVVNPGFLLVALAMIPVHQATTVKV